MIAQTKAKEKKKILINSIFFQYNKGKKSYPPYTVDNYACFYVFSYFGCE